MNPPPQDDLKINDQKLYLTEVILHKIIREAPKTEIFVTAKNNLLPRILLHSGNEAAIGG
jgi:hypothetical protein